LFEREWWGRPSGCRKCKGAREFKRGKLAVKKKKFGETRKGPTPKWKWGAVGLQTRSRRMEPQGGAQREEERSEKRSSVSYPWAQPFARREKKDRGGSQGKGEFGGGRDETATDEKL